MKTTLLLADVQAMVRVGFRMILEMQGDMEVVGEVADGAEAITAVRRLRPDIVLMDIQMPGMDVLEPGTPDSASGLRITLRKWRLKRGLSLREPAPLSGLHYDTVAGIRRGVQEAQSQSRLPLAAALRVRRDQIAFDACPQSRNLKA
jgi:hypothetical protein